MGGRSLGRWDARLMGSFDRRKRPILLSTMGQIGGYFFWVWWCDNGVDKCVRGCAGAGLLAVWMVAKAEETIVAVDFDPSSLCQRLRGEHGSKLVEQNYMSGGNKELPE
jgi:hypothetical protein